MSAKSRGHKKPLDSIARTNCLPSKYANKAAVYEIQFYKKALLVMAKRIFITCWIVTVKSGLVTKTKVEKLKN